MLFVWSKSERNCTALKQSVASDSCWPAAGVRDSQLFGGPTRTAGFGQGNRKREDPESNLSGTSTSGSARSKPVAPTAAK